MRSVCGQSQHVLSSWRSSWSFQLPFYKRDEPSSSYKPSSHGERKALKTYNQESWQPNFPPGSSGIFHPSMHPPIGSLSMPISTPEAIAPHPYPACRPSPLQCKQAWKNRQKSQGLRTSEQHKGHLIPQSQWSRMAEPWWALTMCGALPRLSARGFK